MKFKFVLVLFLVNLTIHGYSQSAIDHNAMKADVAFLSSDEMEGRLTGTIFQDIAAQYIASRFMQIGLDGKGDKNSFFQTFYYAVGNDPHAAIPAGMTATDSLKIINVVGYLNNNAKQTIVIGAHYDHLGHGDNGFSLSTEKGIHNGADDNASGVSLMLQLAQALKKSSSASYNYLFLAFSGEEYGLWGSNYFVKHPTVDLKQVAAMINLDMVGRLKDDHTILIGGVGTSPIWKDLLHQSNVSRLNLTFDESGAGPSDHTSFYFKDIPVLFFFTGQHGDYHKPSDDYDKINFSGMASITENIYTLLKVLDKHKEIPFTKTVDKENENVTMKVTLGIMPDYLYNSGGLRVDGVREGRPGSNAGIQIGDIIIKLGKYEIKEIQTYMQALNGINPGEQVDMIYIREGKEVKGKVQF